MTQKKIWIVVGVVVVALIVIKVIAALSSRPKPIEQSFAPEQLLPIENAAPIADIKQQDPAELVTPAAPGTQAHNLAQPQPAAQPAVPATPTVTSVQAALKNAGYDPGAIDGKLGKKTKTAIVEFQKANELSADGKVGSKTWAKLSKYLTVSSQQ